MSVQSVARVSDILTVIGSAAWSGVLIGDYINLHGVRLATNGSDLGVDGAYRVRNISGTTLTLEAIGTTVGGVDIVTTNCGGGVIKRTDLRISYARIFDFEHHRVEFSPKPVGDMSSAAPVTVANTVTASASISGGQAAHDAVIAGNPVRIGARALTALYTAVATGDQADLVSTLHGALVEKPYAIPEACWDSSLALTTTTATAIQAAAGAGLKRHVTALQAINTGASAVDLILLDGVTERWRITLPPNTFISVIFPTGITVTANTALNANLSAAGTVRLNIQGYTAA